MKRLAFISPMVLPVDNKTGGGVEQLMYSFITQNENNPVFIIDLFTVPLSDENKKTLKYTNLIEIKLTKVEILVQKIRNLFNWIFRFDKCDIMSNKISKFLKYNKYDKILVENRMGFCKKILNNGTKNVYYHMHNDFDESDKTLDNYLYIESRITKIFTVSDYIKQRLQSKRNSLKIVEIPNCIDLSKFEITQDDKDKMKALRKKIGFKDRDFIFGFSGRVTEEKGIEELIVAFKKVVKNNDKAKLLIIGNSWFSSKKPSSFEKKLYTLVDKGVVDKIIFTGYVEHDIIKAYYGIMDVLVIPSKCNESFGLVALEAIAMKKNIITTGKGGLKEVTQEVAQMVREDNLSDDLYWTMLNAINNSVFFDGYSKKIETYYEDHKEYHTISYFKSICKHLLEEENSK